MRDHDLSRTRYHQARVERYVRRPAAGPKHYPVRKCFGQTTPLAASASALFAHRRRLVTRDHRDREPIRCGSLSTRDESDQLSWQNRETAWCSSYKPKLEYDPENRKNPRKEWLRLQRMRSNGQAFKSGTQDS